MTLIAKIAFQYVVVAGLLRWQVIGLLYIDKYIMLNSRNSLIRNSLYIHLSKDIENNHWSFEPHKMLRLNLCGGVLLYSNVKLMILFLTFQLTNKN